ncbi:MAG: hypothetical protein IPL46_32720 [Saprospiraceae bacterium]|nr:hypothetical protein [Saprospiraceae bacterium]
MLTSIAAQNNRPDWAPWGAEWRYIYNIGVSNPNNKTYIMTASNDTILAGVSARKLTSRVPDYLNGNDLVFPDQYIHHSGDSIFYFNHDRQRFTLLYNMGAKIGDTIKILEPFYYPDEGDSLIYLEVVDTGSIIVMNERLRTLDERTRTILGILL